MDEVIEFVEGLGGVVTLRPRPGDGSPGISWGDAFCYYAPEGVVPRTQPFATVVTKDYPGDEGSRLGRPGAFRVNVAAGTDEFRRWTGRDPREPATSEVDPGTPDVVFAHPVYGGLGWLAVVEPGPRTAQAVRDLLRTAHSLARARYERRAGAAPDRRFSDYGQRMDDEAVAQVRRFNRTVTQRIGALEDAFLTRSRPLGHSRVLWEIGARGTDVRALRARLDLDSGYLSRVLRALEQEGLVAVEVSPADGRVRVARLTDAGVGERAELDARSDEAAAAVLAGLGSSERGRLVTAMAEVERLLQASMVDVRPAHPADPDARACIAAYVAELAHRFDGGFDPGRSLPAADEDLVPPAGLLLLARLHAEPVGCAALKLHGQDPAEVKRMWVAGSVRGLGVGRRLLGAVEEHARASGVRTLRLETNRALVEAIALYRSAGYREVPAFSAEPFAHHWFEKRLDGQ